MVCARSQAAATKVSTPQTVVKTEGKTHQSPVPKGPGLVSPDNTPPKSDSASPLNMSQSADKCCPIAQLTMYMKPIVKGRVGAKDSVREFKGRDGSTKKSLLHRIDGRVLRHEGDLLGQGCRQVLQRARGALAVSLLHPFTPKRACVLGRLPLLRASIAVERSVRGGG